MSFAGILAREPRAAIERRSLQPRAGADRKPPRLAAKGGILVQMPEVFLTGPRLFSAMSEIRTVSMLRHKRDGISASIGIYEKRTQREPRGI